jgi:hypothetical protein
MARYAMVHAQFHYVANVVEWDGDEQTWAPPAGYIMVADPDAAAGPGFTYDETATPPFIPPPSGG